VRTELAEHVRGPGDLLVDLREAGYFSSAGVAMLVEAAALARTHGVGLSVAVMAGSRAERVIHVTGLAESLTIELHRPG
jgi:anti-anti-sigma factor